MTPVPFRRRALAFAAAVAIAVAWGAIVQTQVNLAGLAAMGVDVPLGLRAHTTLRDLAGFAPLWSIVVVVALAPGFFVAERLARRMPAARTALCALAGLVALVVAIRVVDASVPPPTLIWATRTLAGLLAMTAGGALGGVAWARLSA